MQSQRCAAPPTMSRSISVTSAPRVAATVAQVLPAGPPPRITRLGIAANSRTRPDRSSSRGRPRNLIAMSQLRHDPLSGHDVIVAAGRAARPTTFATGGRRRRGLDASARSVRATETETPPEVARVGGGEPDGPGWQVRAFPNLYPIVDAHEVVVLSPDHRSFADLDDNEAIAVVAVLRDRVHTLPRGRSRLRRRDRQPPEGRWGVDRPPARAGVRARRGAARGRRGAGAGARRGRRPRARRRRARGLSWSSTTVGVTVWCPYASAAPYQFRLAHDDAGARFDLAETTRDRRDRDRAARRAAAPARPPG